MGCALGPQRRVQDRLRGAQQVVEETGPLDLGSACRQLLRTSRHQRQLRFPPGQFVARLVELRTLGSHGFGLTLTLFRHRAKPADLVVDLAERRLRLIGDPEVRYREDPVRLLRAARFVAKLGVEPDEDTGRWIPELAHLLEDVPPARLFEETCKLFMTGHGMRSMEALQRFGLSATLFPGLPKGAGPGKMQLGGVLRHSLENTDERVRTEKPVTPAFLYAALLWSEVEQRASHYASQGDPEYVAMMRAAEEAIGEQVRRTAIPRRFSAVTRQIWLLQTRFNKTRGKRWKRLLYEERFRAGYDFLLLRAREDPSLEPLCEFWTKAQQTVEAPSAADRASAKRRDRPGRRYRRRAPSAG